MIIEHSNQKREPQKQESISVPDTFQPEYVTSTVMSECPQAVLFVTRDLMTANNR